MKGSEWHQREGVEALNVDLSVTKGGWKNGGGLNRKKENPQEKYEGRAAR